MATAQKAPSAAENHATQRNSEGMAGTSSAQMTAIAAKNIVRRPSVLGTPCS
jgi:hypothetical protein